MNHGTQTALSPNSPDQLKEGYIQPQRLQELWFHTGTACNLSCPFCLEGSFPGSNRLQQISLADVVPFIEEAMELGVEQFSFTGGEPFVISEIIDILAYALERRPCLVLTNATEPLLNRLGLLATLAEKPHPLSLRVSLDHPDPEKHDAGRGRGNFMLALKASGRLHQMGFHVSIARQGDPDEDKGAVDDAYLPWFEQVGLPADTTVISFPDFLPPDARPDFPFISRHCMKTYKSEEERAHFMCSFSKMVLNKNGRMRVYACTLVDDDPGYDCGGSLKEAMENRIPMRHHRCFTCFAQGASCSEL